MLSWGISLSTSVLWFHAYYLGETFTELLTRFFSTQQRRCVGFLSLWFTISSLWVFWLLDLFKSWRRLGECSGLAFGRNISLSILGELLICNDFITWFTPLVLLCGERESSRASWASASYKNFMLISESLYGCYWIFGLLFLLKRGEWVVFFFCVDSYSKIG